MERRYRIGPELTGDSSFLPVVPVHLTREARKEAYHERFWQLDNPLQLGLQQQLQPD